MGLFHKKKPENTGLPETEDIFFNCPVYVKVYQPGFDEENGDEPTEITGPAAYEYIADDVREAICWDFEASELHKYFSHPNTVFGFSMEIVEDGLAVIKATVAKGITKEMRQEIMRFIDGQMSDGWGEDSEQYFVDDNEEGEAYEVYFWKYYST